MNWPQSLAFRPAAAAPAQAPRMDWANRRRRTPGHCLIGEPTGGVDVVCVSVGGGVGAGVPPCNIIQAPMLPAMTTTPASARIRDRFDFFGAAAPRCKRTKTTPCFQ
jgi:hypothetical protein